MEEKFQVAAVFAATLFLGIFIIAAAGFISSESTDSGGSLYADSYEAVWYDNGTLTERYVYDVLSSGDYRMLYRVWAAPVYSAEHSQNTAGSPHIELIDMKTPDGTAGYIKTKNGDVFLFNDKNDDSQ
ncbi:MAG: DUF2207 domain-containing protein, partial [Methanomicrobium sp.]|nr:DUF2207 domain-containing protein [Methanomicrobium sp.]